ncbi:ABC-type transport system permease protein (probable substrate phosphate) [Natrialba magadii ATCC 43099]|uniref:Phosphate transport system permease protein n=1 Tax=Natrialba magadii (strain ATCC 43099 / DSM 3394 / CCM 3739 / CIP 104546 / IAM 13178 / JCM 8861 / NBRC 102185 / NCIMB 2190 / MS3) TaxID=547559 RepID=D3SXH2_NATMM|nr:phosphate ABC transporter permease subunit PstC [Natrialba magadii]ADD05921.1 ABC-type transport system permease protein (probable substrate phosphate) [Natrialba magadii ATCC 43099]ELY30572.1 phosphate ABC transporter permease [Natrialba magadii ATCC 43099]
MSTETPSGPGISGDDSLEAAHEKNRRVRRVLFGCAAVTVVTTVAIFLVLFDNAASYFFGARISEVLFGGDSIVRTVTFTEFFTGTRWAPDHATPAHGVLPIVAGTLTITVGAGLVSIPIGTATALYLSEYATTGTRNRLKPVLEVLAGIPTIVYGYFAVSFVTPVIVSGIATYVVNPTGSWFDSISYLAPFVLDPVAEWMMGVSVGRYSLLGGILVVGTMTIPMVSSISEDAMQAVPDDLRNGAYALGATKYQVATRIVLPAAVSGIFASYILALSRAIGETMAVTLAAGFNANLTANPFAEIMTMTAYLVSIARGTSAVGTVEYQSLFAVGLLLFLMTLSMNLLNDRLKRRFQEEYR